MKKNLILLLMALIICGCSTYESTVDKNLRHLAYDILQNPEKLRNIKKYYPEYYNQDYISKHFLDTIKVNESIKLIKDKFSERINNLVWIPVLFGQLDLINFKKEIRNQNLTLENLYSFDLCYKGEGTRFIFVKINNDYFIINIGYCYDPYYH
ncbi:MAG: hypothetical protein ABSG15_07725 [FCB group bacterium]|jgi:hypothetical protein